MPLPKPIDRLLPNRPVVSVVRLSGVIGGGGSLRRGMTLAGLAGTLEKAFSGARVHGVALAINSPGGSPVQSSLIAERIRLLAEEKGKPVFAFVEDVAASGGYWLASAADEIYADSLSIVGSVGVIAAGFGFSDLIARHGIERRVYTAGQRKQILDPFQPEREDDVERIRAIQHEMHAAFKDLVRRRRGTRLKADDETLFEGDFWTGAKALDLGLIDGIGHLRPVMRARFGNHVRLRVIGERKSWLKRRFNMGGVIGGAEANGIGIGGDAVAAMFAALEERAFWQRYGL